MTGYVGEPEWNRRVFHDGFFRTGDLGHIDTNGNLYLAGRMGRVMNIAGMKVDPVEIERTLEALAGVSTCHVDAAPSSRVGEVIRARVVIRQDVQITRGDVIEHCRQRLAEYKLPRIIEFVEALPATLAGKMPR
jgi:acyl-CoA synthetase (AMP-forming)/AMP-acid ligase II